MALYRGTGGRKMMEFLEYLVTCEKEKLITVAIFFALILARPIVEQKLEELKGGV